MPLKIDQMFAFVSVDENGDEGICAFCHDGTWHPMVGADWDRIQSLKPAAEKIAKYYSNQEIRLVKFESKTLIETISSGEKL